jgi:hypothetical protein
MILYGAFCCGSGGKKLKIMVGKAVLLSYNNG